MTSCLSSHRKEPQIYIRYKIPDVYFPKIPLIVFNWDEDKQQVYITEDDLKLLMLYFEQTEAAIETLYSVNDSINAQK